MPFAGFATAGGGTGGAPSRLRADEGTVVGGLKGCRERLGEYCPLSVSERKRAALNSVCDRRQVPCLPVRYLDEVVVELPGGIDRILDLRLCSPAGRRALLEQPERVPVAVVEVAQPRLLLGGRQRDHDGALGQPPVASHLGDRRGVRDLLGGERHEQT